MPSVWNVLSGEDTRFFVEAFEKDYRLYLILLVYNYKRPINED